MKEWYSTKIRYILVTPNMKKSKINTKIDVTYLLKANDFEDAFKLAVELGKKKEKLDSVKVNNVDSLVPRFKEILTLDFVGKELDGAEIVSELSDIDLNKPIDFETKFKPEDSNPTQTI